MGWFRHITSVVRHVVHNPVKAVARVVHNPTRAILNKHIRSSKGFKNIGRPIIKIGTAVAVGALTGGIGAVATSGLLAADIGAAAIAGGLAGGLASGAGGGLSNKPFRPIQQVAIPAAAGLLAGIATPVKANIIASKSVTAVQTTVSSATKVAKLAKSGIGAMKAIKHKKAILEQMRAQAAAARSNQASALELQRKRAELAALKASQVAAPAAVPVTPGAVNVGKAASDKGGMLAGAAGGALIAGMPGAVVGAVAGAYLASRKTTAPVQRSTTAKTPAHTPTGTGSTQHDSLTSTAQVKKQKYFKKLSAPGRTYKTPTGAMVLQRSFR